MVIRQLLMPVSMSLFTCLALGCGSSREVEIKGEVASPATIQVEGSIALQFFDVLDAEKPSLVHSIKLDRLGMFAEKPAVQGQKVLVRAINDRDGNAACSAGEPWAEAQVVVKEDDSVDPVTLELTAGPCPAE